MAGGLLILEEVLEGRSNLRHDLKEKDCEMSPFLLKTVVGLLNLVCPSLRSANLIECEEVLATLTGHC